MLADEKVIEETQQVRRLAASIVSTWHSGKRPAAAAVIKQHPELRKHKELVVDLAYEEYRLRREQGEDVSASVFCEQFPSFQKSIRRALNIHWDLVDGQGLDDWLQREQQATEIQWPKLGTEFAGFFLKEELGRGGIARVYLATQPLLGDRYVAVKISRRGFAEAKTLGQLQHVGVVPIHGVEFDQETELTAIAMPFLGRTTLCDLLDAAFDNGRVPTNAMPIHAALRVHPADLPLIEMKERPNSLRLDESVLYADAVLEITRQLAVALAYTHGKGFLHADLKPSNILLTPDGAPMLLDFNLSANTNALASRVGGTVQYMPPETLTAVIADIDAPDFPSDPRSDIFSLGVILFEMLTGHLPFGEPEPGEKLREAAQKVLECQQRGLVPTARPFASLDRECLAVVTRCLEYLPEDRPASAAELADELEQLIVQRHRRRSRRKFVLAGAAAVAGIAVTSGAVAAVRDPYDIRQFNKGTARYEAKEFHQALSYFDAAVKANPKNPHYLFARGQTYRQIGNLQSANADYRATAELHPAGIIRACVAYCAAHGISSSEECVDWSLKAIENGYETAAVRSLLARGYSRTNQLDESERQSRRAIELDPNFAVAYLQLAIRISNSITSGQGDRRYDEGIEAAETAVRLDPRLRDMYRIATYLSWLGFKFTNAPRFRERAHQNFLQMLQSGCPFSALEHLVKEFANDEEIQRLVNQPNREKPIDYRLNIAMIPFNLKLATP